jgi:hypothetical protein
MEARRPFSFLGASEDNATSASGIERGIAPAQDARYCASNVLCILVQGNCRLIVTHDLIGPKRKSLTNT